MAQAEPAAPLPRLSNRIRAWLALAWSPPRPGRARWSPDRAELTRGEDVQLRAQGWML